MPRSIYSDLMTMRRSPRRPLILRRRKLPFQQNDPPAAAKPQSQTDASGSEEPPKSASQCFPDGIRIMDHPSMSDTQVVVIPKTADLHSVIGALTAKGKECGVLGPNKFILLSENSGSVCQPAAGGDGISAVGQAETVGSSPDAKPLTGIKALNKELECGPLDDSLTNIQWLGRMDTCVLEADPAKQTANKENQNPNSQTIQIDVDAVQQPMSERPPYSYMAMIQFAINSRKSRRMTLKEIYMWIEDHFPYFREVAKPGWKNSIRHNLSLHDMFIRETSPDGKISFWTIRPEANRCLTLDQVYKPGCDPMTAPVPVPMLLFPHQQQKRMLPDARKLPPSSERRMKPLLPRTDSYFVPIQLPVASSIYLPSSSTPFPSSCSQQKRNALRGTKRVRIAPKVTQSDVPAVVVYPQKDKDLKVEVKEEPVCVPMQCGTPKATPKRQASSSRRKQRLVHSLNEEPVLLCPDNTFFDSGVASDASTFQDMRDTELEEQQQPEQHSPDRDFSFKTPIKSSSHLTSSTPSKPPSHVLPETWKVTPVGKGSESVLDFSPIRTPGGPAVTPRHDYTTFSFNSTPFKDWPLFSSPRELLTSAPSRATGPTDSPMDCLRSSCSRELLQGGGGSSAAPAANRSITEGLVLDTMNDSLSKILVDISFSGLDDEDLGMANISWSEFIPQFK
ncbi:forkhead box protein M1 isoform X1 [Sebastes umbrosus]|uniref:forkhead box protein M1 isoform X1 n=1 Tax=Sebastes umbrosus TaxID=72105 RepID=UPI0018A0AF1C|nr:forkhead box protein M1 isoform X1 [Sebastes umbrosus]XP_037616818.1 forkhead box protein M1 isoform X1 [Sebastes umbrosus]XP_037616819.1 forkhead box protein M1 isoform X1 [Sebastes umbrosus]XP_037616820.1 forkhead box protein M1 isoform X1 [Sebastes umbrosus]XP_037616821.1 forkhead box protein M1 isoform X1 [Sebastes umbrosus]